MLRIPCPCCGVRDETEFAYGGDANVARPQDNDKDQSAWLRYVFERPNICGMHREYWHHTLGCRQWLIMERDTQTHEITMCELARPMSLPILSPSLPPSPSFPPPRHSRAGGNPAITVARQRNTPAPNRLPTGGRINRAHPLTVTFDNKQLQAYKGDTLASAMLASNVKVVARSFKYHRPRGVYSAGAEEPCALVHIGEGARGEPNVRANAEAFDGMKASGQHAFPNVRFDIGAAAGLLSPFIAAGFYYKTFIGLTKGTSFWMLCEKHIRRAAGMGRAPEGADPDTYEKINTYCDILIIGAGETGLSAALAAGRAGASVIVAEQDFALGGALLSSPINGESDEWLKTIIDELRAMPNVSILTRAVVFGAYEKDVFAIVQNNIDNNPRQRYIVARTKQAVLATGALERPLVFANNDLPGVMLANAARAYLNRHAVLAGKNIVVAANNDSAHAAARELSQAGANVKLIDARPALPAAAMSKLKNANVEVITAGGVIKASGWQSVSGALIGEVDEHGILRGKTQKISCDLIAVSGGWNPAVHLWSQRRGKLQYDDARQCFVPAAKTDGIMHFAEGATQGFESGKQAATNTGAKQSLSSSSPLPPGGAGGGNPQNCSRDISKAWSFAKSKTNPPPKAFVDLQHDVTLADIDLAHREGYRAAEHAKRYTTSGMANDQGKTSAANTAARLAALRGEKMGDVGIPTFRPPYTPITIGAITARKCGMHFHPLRRTPLHEWHQQRGAKFIEASAWLRPWYYPKDGETLRDASIREAEHTREHAGIIEIGTLGKIAVQGPDAAELLNLLYVNEWRTLPAGRLRYGVMLREDGFAMDDGATARIADDEYFMTTTTANAARVLSFAEKMLQTQWQNLRAHVTSITDQWAAFAVAGPKSRQVLTKVLHDADLSPQSFQPNDAKRAFINDIPVRVHRLSFSGELAFEIYAPSANAVQAWRAIILAGEEFNLQPYGTEAMGIMRIEKGHPAGAEIDGNTTLNDLGFAKLASDKKPFVGSVLRNRPALLSKDRHRLVGLQFNLPLPRAGEGRGEGQCKGIPAGSLIYPRDAKPQGNGDGWISSTTYSPTLKKHIALAFVKNGAARKGEVVRVVDFVGNGEWHATIVRRCFYDPENRRQNA